MSRQTVEEKNAASRERELYERFGSLIALSVRVLRPYADYPYERSVWESEIRVRVEDENRDVDAVITAWIKTMESGVEMAKAFASNGAGSGSRPDSPVAPDGPEALGEAAS